MKTEKREERFFHFSPSGFCLQQKPPPSEREGIRGAESSPPTLAFQFARSVTPHKPPFVILRRKPKNIVLHILLFVRFEILRFAQDDKYKSA